jgi:predicted metal-dependent hydrolase
MADDLDGSSEIPVFARCWNEGDFFMAHEVLEGLWIRCRDEGLRGLIQLAVALYHIERGNRKGARTMIERARPRLQNLDNAAFGIDLAMMDAYAARVGAALAAAEPDAGRLNKIVAARPRI